MPPRRGRSRSKDPIGSASGAYAPPTEPGTGLHDIHESGESSGNTSPELNPRNEEYVPEDDPALGALKKIIRKQLSDSQTATVSSLEKGMAKMMNSLGETTQELKGVAAGMETLARVMAIQIQVTGNNNNPVQPDHPEGSQTKTRDKEADGRPPSPIKKGPSSGVKIDIIRVRTWRRLNIVTH